QHAANLNAECALVSGPIPSRACDVPQDWQAPTVCPIMRRTTRPESPPQPRPLHGPEARLELEPLAIGAATLRVAGTWSNATVPRLWPRVDEIFEERDFSRLVLEASGLRTLDGAGMALLLRLKGRAQEEGVSLEWRGLA